MTIAIHYSSVKQSAETREIFGLQVAVFNWLKAFFRYGKQDKFEFLISSQQDWEEVQKAASGINLDPKRLVALDRRFMKENLGRFETIFRADADTQKLFWQRQQIPGVGFNVCSLTHAIAGIEAGEVLEQYCLAPSESTDAIVCPSRAAQASIRSFWDLYSDYLEQRFGTTFNCPVQLPLIPLGIDVEKYENLATPDKRVDQRKKLGLAEDETVLLWVGRLSHAIKAHPLAMFQAAERAAEKTGAKIHLVMVGYFVPAAAEQQFKKMAADFCSKAKVTFIASDDTRFPDGLWAAGDIFLSLIDNYQESFGLTPIEAMAAGLPRVLSDWDGYRDSVTHGEDGFLVPTTQPPPGSGNELSSLLLSGREVYGGYLAKSALSVAIDQEKAADAIALLVTDKNKRKSMADKARTRARATYDWKHIIPAYELLWQELAARRKLEKINAKPSQWPSVLPQAPDPFSMYVSYPTKPLAESDRLTVIASTDMIEKLWRHEINIFAMDIMIHPNEATKLIGTVTANDGITIGAVFKQFPALDQPQLWRTIGWLVKLGILRVV